MFDGIILYGPPASGKDAVTAELCKLSERYSYFEKLKAGEGRTDGYRKVSEAQLAELRGNSDIVHEVTRYGATYAVDSTTIDKLIRDGRIPIVHMGQVAGINALRQRGSRWLDVLLWCPKDVAEERLRQRGSADIDDRISVWNWTLVYLKSFAGPPFRLSIRTDSVAPAVTAAVIHAAMTQS